MKSLGGYKAGLTVACSRLDPTLWRGLREFRAVGNQSDLDTDEAAIQKRFWNLLLAKRVRFARGLDLFAGVGYSSRIFQACCDALTVVENDPKTYELLASNLKLPVARVDAHFGDNLDFIDSYSGEKFDFVDIDPFGSPIPQLDRLDKIFGKGVVAVTSGTIARITRGLDKTVGAQYRGRGAIRWAVDEYLPGLARQYDLKLEAYYLYPTSIRAIFTRGFDLPSRCFPGEALLGWFRSKS